MSKEITSRAQDYSQWYNDLVIKGELADYSAVRGCMVIKPYGFALWENMRDAMDKMFKDTGHQNAYFPLFVPKSLFEAEEKNAEGFAKECAIVTHYRLKTDPDKKGKLMVDPEAKLEEELIIRPTSEAIIWNTYKGWIQSYRDLPLLINQWCNVVRWEMRTRLFLRTAEFLWQEGHTAHATQQEAEEEAMKILMDCYRTFAEEWMAMPVLTGPKSEGQKFQDASGKLEFAWATSWGVSTRLVGGLIMTHSDDNGLVLPPRLAPTHVVIVPLGKNEAEQQASVAAAEKVAAELRALPRDDFY